jgi:hypothetical protein
MDILISTDMENIPYGMWGIEKVITLEMGYPPSKEIA